MSTDVKKMAQDAANEYVSTFDTRANKGFIKLDYEEGFRAGYEAGYAARDEAYKEAYEAAKSSLEKLTPPIKL